MSLISYNIPQAKLEAYIGPPDNVLLKTNIQKLNEIVPSAAFAPNIMVQLKDELADKIASFGEAALPKELVEFRSTIQSITPAKLSAALYSAGFNPINFNIKSFDFSIQSITNIQNSIMGFEAALSGGCSALVSALSTITSIVSLSISDITSFFQSVLQKAVKTVTEVMKDIVKFVTNIKENLKKAFDTLMETVSSSLATVQKFVKDLATSIATAFSQQISSLLLGVKSIVASLISIAISCGNHLQSVLRPKIENNKREVKALSTTLTETNPNSVQRIQKEHYNNLKTMEDIIEEDSKNTFEAQVSAFIQSFTLNNPDADDMELVNAVQTNIAAASQWQDQWATQKIDEIQRQIRETSAICGDLSSASGARIADAIANGRPAVKKADAIAAAIEWSGARKQFYEAYFGGPYAAEIAIHVNELHPKVRQRFADALRDMSTNEDLIKANILVRTTSSTRSYAKQQELYNYYKPRGTPVASPGNSWHNFGCAVDIQIIVDGTPKEKTSSYYAGLPREFFGKYNLTNPIRNDYIHFQPKELIISPATIKEKLLIPGTTRVNQDAVGALLSN